MGNGTTMVIAYRNHDLLLKNDDFFIEKQRFLLKIDVFVGPHEKRLTDLSAGSRGLLPETVPVCDGRRWSRLGNVRVLCD